MQGTPRPRHEKTPQVTVVIPAYRAEHTIARAVDSVLAQVDCSPRVIVVVDGDLDATAERVAAYSGSPVELLVNDRNRGVQFTRNRGLSHVKDEFVMFLDADDFLEGRLLSGLLDRMHEADAELGFGPMQASIEHRNKRGPAVSLAGRSREDIFVGWLAKGRFVGTCSVIWRTDYLREIGGWDLEIDRQEDGELVLRALLLGARFACSDEGRGIYVIHDSPHRLSRSNANLQSLLQVPEKLLALPSNTIPSLIVRDACGASLHNAARVGFVRGHDQMAEAALARSYELGYRARSGWRPLSLLDSLVGLRRSAKLERLARQILGR